MNIRSTTTRRITTLLGASLLGLALATPGLAANDLPFQISVDGQVVTGSNLPAPAEENEKSVEIDVKFDGLGVEPKLSVATAPMRGSYRTGEDISFRASLNYAGWVERGEIRIYKRGERKADGLLATLEVKGLDGALWQMPADAPEDMEYVLRVYDADGRFDETRPLPLRHLEQEDQAEERPASGYAEDLTAVRNIDIHGGVVSVFGRNVPGDHQVIVMGEPVAVDADGTFMTQRILPSGNHHIAIKVEKDGEGLDFSRDVEVPENEWFSVGLADFTAGYNLGDHVESLRPGEFTDDVYTRGRLAFYLKGKIKGRYLLTAAADTGDQKLKEIFKGLDGKDPRQFLTRLDPDDYYPVYGDDSTRVEDAPTRGKFYVRLEKGPSHVMWGNFKADITGARFIRTERALYGAKAAYRSQAAAPDGGARTKIDAHAAMPGTAPNRDVFRGTGGSAYFVSHQDVTPGTETVSVEVRNSTTDWVVERRTLKFGTDYDFDYVQGVILLRSPLSSSDVAGTENYLVTSYEFTPATRDVDGYALGGRVQQWVGDNLRVGVTAMREKTESANQTIAGADIHLRASEDTYIEAEVARSKGPGFGSTYSPDGGITIQNNASAGAVNKTADAYRIEARVALEDITKDKAKGKVIARYEHFDKDFSSLDVNATERRELWGVEGDLEVTDKVKAAASFSEERKAGTNTTLNRQANVKIQARISDEVSIEPYGSYVEKDAGSSATATTEQGTRADVGIKVIHAWNDNEKAYVFAQKTVKRTGTMDRDDRVGVGGAFKLGEHASLEGEVSYGTQGPGASALLAFDPNEDSHYYLGYKLDPTRDTAKNWPFELVGDDLGTIVVGGRHRFNEQWSAYGEDNFDVFGERMSVTQAYGVTYTPNAEWSVTTATEWGHVFDNTVNPTTLLKNPDFDRKAISLALDYKSEKGIEGRIKGEARFDDSEENNKDLSSYLVQASLNVKASENWRAIASFDGVFTDATDATRGGDYAEGSVGFAYRPAEGDKFNALAKYTYLYDLPGADQVSIDGTTSSPAQRSHIVSLDASYDITPKLTLGAKYGARIGEIRERIAGAAWERSHVHLGVVRADLHVVHQWDLLVEGRALWSPTTNEADFGAIAAIYRHFGDNMKVGIGYNFGRFSDDLRDLSQNDHGVFLNVIGKF